MLYAVEYAPVLDFDVNGGKGEVNSIVSRAGDAIKLPTPTRNNYKFLGWENSGGTIFSGSSMPTTSAKLTAKWQAMLVFNTNGGLEVANISEPQGTKITLPKTEKAGYMFAGWYTESGEEYTNVAMPSASVVLQAKYWKIEKETKVLIDETSSYYVSNDRPSVDAYCKELDLSELYDKGVREIMIKVTYENYKKGSNSSSPKYTYLTWYSTKTASDAYKIWHIEDKHIDTNWGTYTKSTLLNLTSGTFYLCFWDDIKEWNYASYWRNFYIEI